MIIMNKMLKNIAMKMNMMKMEINSQSNMTIRKFININYMKNQIAKACFLTVQTQMTKRDIKMKDKIETNFQEITFKNPPY